MARKSVGTSVDYARKLREGTFYVDVWVRRHSVSLTPREARRFAIKVLQAADRCEHQASCEAIRDRRSGRALNIARAAIAGARG